MTDVARYIDLERPRVNAALQNFFAQEAPVADKVHALAREVFDTVAEFTLGPGKRLRPILMITGYRASGGSDEQAILAASCCLELTQSMLLIHDDIMDKSAMRRGRPSVHAAYRQRYSADLAGAQGRSIDAEHFGVALAIAAGDLAGQLALRSLSVAGFPECLLARVLDVYTAMTRDVCYGQVLDMHAGDGAMHVTEADVLAIHRYKTARYTTEGPLHMGAVLASASPDVLAVLSAYALPLGQAFQLQDDLLGVFGNEAETGKSSDEDIRQGKRTLLVIKALEWGSPAQVAAVTAALGNCDASRAEVAAARQVLDETGARAYCQSRAVELAAEARAAMSSSSLEPRARQFLASLADYVVARVR